MGVVLFSFLVSYVDDVIAQSCGYGGCESSPPSSDSCCGAHCTFDGSCWNCEGGTPAGPEGCSSCFLPGTKIAMADGTKKNVEDMKVGDKVLSYEPSHRVIEYEGGNTIKVYPDSEFDTNHQVINDDGTWTIYIYSSKQLAILRGTLPFPSLTPTPKPKLNFFEKVKNKWDKIVEYFTPPLERI